MQVEYIQDANLGSPLHDAITTSPAVIADFIQRDPSVLLADHALMFQQVEAERGAQAVQVEYIQDANLMPPVHELA